MKKYFNEINFSDAFDNSDLIRLSNFIETEFTYNNGFDFNNREGLNNILYDYNLDTIEDVIDLLFKNDNLKRVDEFLFFDLETKSLKSINRKWLFDYVMRHIPNDLCNGEFKEIVEDCLGYEIIMK